LFFLSPKVTKQTVKVNAPNVTKMEIALKGVGENIKGE